MKKTIIPLAAAIILIAGILGGIFAYQKYKEQNIVIEVAQVSELAMQDYGAKITTQGSIKQSENQEVYLTSDQIIEEIKVQVGDAVSVGTQLIQLDTTLQKLDLEKCQIETQKIELELKSAEEELKRLKDATPYTETQEASRRSTDSRTSDSDSSSRSQTSRQTLPAATNPPAGLTQDPITEAPVTAAPEVPVTVAPEVPATVVPEAPATAAPEAPAPEVPATAAPEVPPTAAPEVPATAAPEDPAPTTSPVNVSNTISSVSQAAGGSGSSQDPYVFICSPDTYISTYLLLQLISGNASSNFRFYNENDVLLYTWQLNGNNLGRTVSQEEIVVDSASVQSRTLESGNESFIQVGEDILNMYPNARISLNADSRATSSTEESTEDLINYYTREELDKLIRRKEEQIKELELSKKEQEVEYKMAQLRLDEASISSTVSGTVASIGSIDNVTNDGKPFIVINTDGDGLVLEGTISEDMLGTIQKGTIISAEGMDESGESIVCSAEVTGISLYPSGDSSSGGIPNTSYYPFTAYISDTDGLRQGMWLNITLGTSDSSGVLYIDKMYVREDEEENSYVYAVSSSTGLLEKRIVKTGKILYDSYIGIRSGLTEFDYIAFPYGSDVVEGRRVKRKNPVETEEYESGTDNVLYPDDYLLYETDDEETDSSESIDSTENIESSIAED